MKKFLLALMTALLAAGSLQAIEDGSQWAYLGTSPSGTGKAYTGVAELSSAGDIIYNPAAPAFINRLTVYGNYGFLSQDSILNGGVSLPIQNGILSAGGSLLTSQRQIGSYSGFHVGFAKMIVEGVAFGFKGYVDSQGSGNKSDIALGVDLGAIIAIKSLMPFSQGFGIKNNLLGIALTGLGKPSAITNTTPLPGMGVKGGLSGDWMDYGFIKGSAALETTVDFFPFNIYGNLGLTFNIAEHLKLKGGLILGNNGLGGLSDGLLCYTLGAAFAYKFGETPVEISYSFNPHQFGTNGANHFLGLEIGFGTLDSNPPKVNLTFADANTNIIYFSPNYDGSQDIAALKIDVSDESLIQGWEIDIMNERYEVVRQIKGEPARDLSLDVALFWKKLWAKKEAVSVPSTFEWNGTSDSGNLLPEGKYYVCMKASDEYKNTGYSQTNSIILDITPPNGILGISDTIFFPVGTGRKSSVTISQKLSPGDTWKAEVRDMNGSVIKDWNWGTNSPAELVWDGKDSSGKLAPDGTYDYVLYGQDLAGNRSILPIKGINLTTKAHSVFLTLDKNGFSPAVSKLKITPALPDSNGLVTYKLEVFNNSNALVKDWKGTIIPDSFTWDGKDSQSKPVPDGDYKIRFSTEYRSGETATSQDYPVNIDTIPPAVDYSAEPEFFSPDGDGENDTLFIHLKITDPQGVSKWKLMIYDPDNKPFKSFSGEGQPADTIRWDGRSENGELVESAQDYKVKIFAEDAYGNALNGKDLKPVSVDVLVEKTDRGLKIRINNIEFEFGKANLKGKKMPILDRVAQILQKYGSYKIEIQGHTDNIGSEAKNLELSKERAQSVFDYLARKGLGRSRMSINGLGFKYPVADNTTDEGRRKNRRVEFILIKNVE